jgi:outer membrane lipoprotein SlyB
MSKLLVNRKTLLAAVVLALTTVTAQAIDVAKPALVAAAASAVNGVKLATLCSTCGVVTEVKSERRKGKASGVGAVGGAVVGGVVGNKVGDGSTAGTVVGGVAGGLLGNEIEKRTKRHTVWVTTATMKDGTVKKFEAAADPLWKAGTVIEVGADGQLKKR